MATEREIERTALDLADNGDRLDSLTMSIVSAAARYWEGIPGDFCLQHHGGGVLIFGGTNRLTYSPFTGFQADRSYYSERFLANYDRLGPLPGRK